jgi:hypothetical protein
MKLAPLVYPSVTISSLPLLDDTSPAADATSHLAISRSLIEKRFLYHCSLDRLNVGI